MGAFAASFETRGSRDQQSAVYAELMVSEIPVAAVVGSASFGAGPEPR